MRLFRKTALSPAFFLGAAAVFFLYPPLYAAAFCLALLLHEGGHLAAMLLCGIPARGIRLDLGGLTILPLRPCRTPGELLLISLGGPFANLLTAAILMVLPWQGAFALRLWAVSVLLGAYNLLPISPFDGGRALWAILSRPFGGRAEDICDAVSAATVIVLWGAAAGLVSASASVPGRLPGAGLFLAAFGLLFACLPAGQPCKTAGRKTEDSGGKRRKSKNSRRN